MEATVRSRFKIRFKPFEDLFEGTLSGRNYADQERALGARTRT